MMKPSTVKARALSMRLKPLSIVLGAAGGSVKGYNPDKPDKEN